MERWVRRALTSRLQRQEGAGERARHIEVAPDHTAAIQLRAALDSAAAMNDGEVLGADAFPLPTDAAVAGDDVLAFFLLAAKIANIEISSHPYTYLYLGSDRYSKYCRPFSRQNPDYEERQIRMELHEPYSHKIYNVQHNALA